MWYNFAQAMNEYELGATHGLFLRNFGMDPSWVMSKFFYWKIPAGSLVGNLDGGLVGNFQLDPSWGIRSELFLEVVKGHPARTIRKLFGGQMGR